jgi:cell pole-organizing protein PopZ
VTTQPNEQQEPSMEEILSSIRRIIADEETGDGEEGAPEQADAAEREADRPDPAAEDADTDDEDVLELTEVVREDVDVVDLDRAIAQARSIEQQEEAAGPRFGLGNASKPDSDEDAQPEPEAPLETVPNDGVEPSHEASTAKPSAASKPVDDHPTQSSMDIRDDGMEPQKTTPQNNNGIDSLVSDRAAGAATGAFAKLSQAVQRTPPEVAIADDSGRTVEQFAEDMMRPMLRDWLDEHLPPLIERIVQKEIQKIVRRAEDD